MAIMNPPLPSVPRGPNRMKARACPLTGEPCDCIADLATEEIQCVEAERRSIEALKVTAKGSPRVVYEPEMTQAEAKETVAGKTAPRVTEESIKARIKEIAYVVHGTLTIAIVTMKNGFNVVGKAAPASPANFDPSVGERFAYEDAFKQLWHLEGYLLCEMLNPVTMKVEPVPVPIHQHKTRRERAK